MSDERPSFARAILRERGAPFILGALALLLLSALFAPALAPRPPGELDMSRRHAPPAREAPFGTDSLGRDVLSRTLHGARVSLGVGVVSRGAAIVLGTLLGLLAGYFGGATDATVSRLIDSTLAFPQLLLAIGVAFFAGPGIATLIVSLAVASWAPVARLVRTQAMRIAAEPYVEAARAMNAGHARILFLHILPNCLPLVLVAFTSGIAAAILGESSLSFLGLGPDPSIPTWGQMISSGLKDIFAPPPHHPWIYLFPGAFLFAAVLLFNLAGDLARDALDPRLRR